MTTSTAADRNSEYLRRQFEESRAHSNRFADVSARYLACDLGQRLDPCSTPLLSSADSLHLTAEINRLQCESMMNLSSKELKRVEYDCHELKDDYDRLHRDMQDRIDRRNEIDRDEFDKYLEDYESVEANWKAVQIQQGIDGLPSVVRALEYSAVRDGDDDDLPSKAARILGMNLNDVDPSIIASWAPIARQMQDELVQFSTLLDKSMVAKNEVVYFYAANSRMTKFINRFDAARAQRIAQGQAALVVEVGEEAPEVPLHFLEGEDGF